MEAVVEIIGPSGDSVTIAGEDSGAEGIHLLTEVEGLFDPEIEAVTKASANRPGTRFISHRVLERNLVFKVLIENDEQESWRERDVRWRRLWRFDEYTTVRVTVDGESRDLRARLSEIEVDTTHDPHTNEATEVIMTAVADDPFWYGEPFEYRGELAGSQLMEVPLVNPTGNRVYPVWALEGGTSWTIPQFGGRPSINLPALTDDEDIRVDTDPAARQLVSGNGSLVWARMNGVRFSGYIPAFETVEEWTIKNKSSTPKKFMLRLERPYDRPWGGV